MKIVLQLTSAGGTSELVTIESGENFAVPTGMTAELVLIEGVDDLRVEGGELVLVGSGGTVRIAGLGADFLTETASLAENGIDGPLPEGFLHLFGWLDAPDSGLSGTTGLDVAGQGRRAGDDDGLPPPLDSSNDGDTATAPAAPVISSWSDDTGPSGDGITSDTTLTLLGTAEAGATVTLFDGDTEIGTVTAGSDGTWTFDSATLAGGTHEFTATATNAGGTGEASAPVMVTVDTAAPEAPVISGYSADTGAEGDGITSGTTLTLTGTAEAGVTVEIFDGATSLGTTLADGAGAWSFTTGELGDGEHDFTAIATDAAGNTGDASDAFTVEVDTAAPAAPVISGFSDDTGTQGDGITSDTALTLTGTAEPGATVTIFDGATELGTALANGAGAWSFTTGELGEGEHDFTATATDAAGNIGDASAVFPVEIDTSGPSAPVIAGLSEDTGIADDGVTSDTTLTLTGTADAGATVTVFDGPHVLGTAIADGDGNWSFDTVELSEGAYQFTATATDAVGNIGERSENFDVVVDVTPPAIEITTPISGDGLVNASEGGSLSVSGTAAGGQQVFVTFRDAGGATVTGTAFVDGLGDWTLSGADISGLENGEISIEVYAVDRAGNQSATVTETVTFDSGLPAAPVITGFTDNTGFGGDNLTSDTTPTLTGTAEAGTTVEIFDGQTSLGTVSVDGAGNWSFTTGTLAEGAHTLTARATDEAGNGGAVSAPLNLGIDTTAPAVSIATPIAGDGLVNAAEDGFFAVSGTSAGGQRVYVTFTDGGGATVSGSATVDGLGNWTLNADISGLDEGTITVEAYAEDQVGNRSDTVDVTITHDSVAPDSPVITGFSEDTGSLGDGRTSDNTVTLTGTAAAGVTVEIFIGVTSLGTVIADEAGAWSFTSEELADGSHYFNAVAIDTAGNRSISSDNYIVAVDTVPPGLTIETPISSDGIVNASEDNSLSLSGTAPGGQRVYVTLSDEDGATVTGETIVVGGNWTLTGVDISGLADGDITVEAYAVDQAGNSSGTVTETIGHDTIAPAAPVVTGFSDDSGAEGDNRTNDTTPTLTGTAQMGTTVQIRDGGTLLGTAEVDGDGNWSFTTAELAEGSHSFTVRAADAAGNLGASASLGLTIDTTAHAVAITTPIAVDNIVNAAEDGSVSVSGTAAGAQRVYVTFRDESGSTVDGGYAIVVGGGNWTLSGVDISGLQNGEITVEAYSVDQAGNQSDTATETVTLDNVAPAVPVIVDFSDDTGFDGDNQTADNTLTFTGTAEAGVTVNVYLGAAIVATGIADVDGNWTAATGTLDDGYSIFTARAVDPVGNQSGASDPFVIIIDTEAPGAPTLDGYSLDTGAAGDGVTGDSNLLLSGTSPAGVSRIVIYDNGVEIGTVIPNAGAWTFQTGELDDGDHSFTAAARDNVGNESAGTGALAVTIDTENPDAPVITGFSDDTGDVGDGITADTTLTIAGTSEANATISIFNQGSFLGTTVADGNGDWSYDAGALNQGAHTFTARAADVAGNVSPMSDSLDVTISIPVTPAPVITGFSGDSGTVGDFLTNDATLTIEGTSVADATVEVFRGGVSLGTTTADGSGNWSFTTDELADGSHIFHARATASLSSPGTYSDQFTVTVDTTAPVVTISDPVDGDNIVGAFSDGSFTVSGSAPGGQQIFVTFRDGSGATVTGTASVSGGGSWTLTGADISALDDGTVTIEVYAVDQAGNQSDTVTHDILLDNDVPAAPVISGFSDDTGTQVGSTSDTTLTFTGTAEANATVQLFRTGSIVGTTTADGDGNWTITTGELSEGYATYEARAVDAAGNTSGWSNDFYINIDTTAPATPAILAFSEDSGVQGDGLTNDTALTLTGTGAAGSTVVIYDDGVELGTAQVNGGGTWSFTTATLADGDHSFTAAARDGAGNESAETAAFEVAIDATRPDIPVITGYSDDTGSPDFQTSDNTLVFTGTAGAGETINVYLGQTLVATGIADENGDWSAATGVIADGFHYFYARAVDAAGNQSLQSGNYAINVDTVAPAAPVITGFTNDNGAATDDGVSSSNWTYLSGTAATGSSTVVIYRDGAQIGTAAVSGGSWTFLVSALPEGTHTFTATARDFVGNESGESNEVEFTVDLTAPPVPVLVSMSDDTGTPGDFRTSDTTPTFSGTAEAGATVTVRTGSTVLGTTVADIDGNWSYTADTLAEGSHAITVMATDAAGRSSSYSGAQLVFIDTTAPDAPVITGFSDDSLPTGDGATSDTTPTLSGTAAANSLVEILSGGSVIGSVTSAGNGTWSFTTEELAEGSYSFTARVSDNAGNVSDESAALDLTIGSGAPPATATPVIALYSNDTGVSGDGITSDTALDLYGTAASGATVDIFDGGVSLGTATADGAGNWHFLTDTLAEGDHDFTVVATAPGGYGPSDPSAALSITIDTAAPAAPVIAGFSDDTGHSSSDNQTSDNTLNFTGTADANVTVNIFRGGGIVATTTADGNGDWSVTTGTIADGYATYEARALDAAGNMSAPSNSMTIGIDTVAPAAPVITGFSPDSGTQGDGVTTNNFIAITGTAEGGTRHVVVYDNGVEVGQATVNGTTWVFYTESLSEGAHEFTAIGYDYSGNESGESGALTVTIDDTAPPVPVITAISEDTGSSATDMQTTDTTPTIIGTAEAGATVRVFINGVSAGVTVADGNGDWSFTTATLADGYHNVTARTEDAAGNQSAQTGAMYVVVDTAPPAITVTTPIASDNLVNASEDNYFNVSGTSLGGQTVYVTFTDELGGTVTGTATVNGTSWTLNGANISGLQSGEITVEAYAVDRAGNQSGTVTNTIELDNVAPAAPVITGFTDQTGTSATQTSDTTPTLTGTAGAGETVRVYLAGSQIGTTVADGNGNWSVTTSALPEGYHSITARALDDAGNLGASSNSQIVWVDTTPPAAPTIDSWGSDTGTVGDDITDDNTITLSGTRPVATLVNIYDNGVLLGTVPMTGTTWSFTTAVLPDGGHSFTVTALDGAANESAASTPLDIAVQTVPPVLASNDAISSVPDGWTVFEDNGHAYSLVGAENYWANAQSRAAAALPGESYLLTITSAEENAFVTTINSGRLWLGATDVATEGTWMWQTGPEAGTAFWFGDSSGSAVDGAYTNWASGQPSVIDGFGADEDYLIRNDSAQWNDSLSYDTYYAASAMAEIGGNGHSYADDVNEDAVYTFAGSILLQNDDDGASISSVSATSTMGASLTYDSGTGEIAYDPTAAASIQALVGGQTATDSFTYTLAGGSSATVSIEVAGRDEVFMMSMSFTPDASSLLDTSGEIPGLPGDDAGGAGDEESGYFAYFDSGTSQLYAQDPASETGTLSAVA
jgi:VCBS repeat-containing protein